MKVREMVAGDISALVDVQQAGAVVGLSAVFRQDLYPFPREAVRARWSSEIADPKVGAYVATDPHGSVVGFAAINAGELLHFGTAVETWGSGVATDLLQAMVVLLRQETDEPKLRVFADNHRGRRFYEKHGWQPTGEHTLSDFEPHPVLLGYSLLVSG